MHLDLNYAESESFKEYIKALKYFDDPKISKPNIAARSIEVNGKRYRMGLYGSISSTLQGLRNERSKCMFEYRALMTHLLYSHKDASSGLKERVDRIATQLFQLSSKIEALCAYREALNATSDTGHKQAVRARAELEKNLPKDDALAHLELLNRIHDIDAQLHRANTPNNDIYPIDMPFKADGAGTSKVHKGGSGTHEDITPERLEKIKHIVKLRFGIKKN